MFRKKEISNNAPKKYNFLVCYMGVRNIHFKPQTYFQGFLITCIIKYKNKCKKKSINIKNENN